MAAGNITIDLLMRTGSFETDTKRAAANLRKLEKEAVAVGKAFGLAFVTAGLAVAAFAKSQINALDNLVDVADATGATVENLSALERVAKLNGQTLDDVSGVLIKFNKALLDADGKNGVSDALSRIGLSAQELRRLDPAEALRQTAVALSRFADDGDKARLVQELFGKSVKEAAPFLKDLAEQGQLNATVTTEQAKAAEQFNKELFLMKTNAEEAARSLTSDMVSALNQTIEKFREGKREGKGFFQTLRDEQLKILGLGPRPDANYGNEGRGSIDRNEDYGNEGRNKRSVGSLVKDTKDKVKKAAKAEKPTEFDQHIKDYIEQVRKLDDAAADAVRSLEAFYQQQTLISDGFRADADAAQEALASFGYSREQIEALQIEKLKAAAAALEHKAMLREERDELDPVARLYREQAAALRDTAKARGELSAKEQFLANDPTAGAKRAVDDYMAYIKKAGDATANAVADAIHSLEDAAVDVLMGGNIKQAAKSLVNQLIAEFYRLQVVRPLLQSLMGGSGFAGLFAGSYSGGSSAGYGIPSGVALATGTNNVPHDNFPALLHKGEAVVPAAYNPAAGGKGGETNVQIINNTGAGVREERSEVGGRKMVKIIVGEVARDMGRGGVTRQAARSAVGPGQRRG